VASRIQVTQQGVDDLKMRVLSAAEPARIRAGRFNQRSWIVAMAAVLLVGVVVLRFLVVSQTEAVLLLCVVPIALIALAFGSVGGLTVASLCSGIVVLYSIITENRLGFWGYASRIASFYFVGALVGRFVEQRRALEEHHTRWFMMARDLFCTAGFDGYFKSLNPAWERVLGFSTTELKSRPYIEFVHPDDRDRTIAENTRLTTEKLATLVFVNRYRAKDGNYRWIEWTATPVHEEQLIYASARDITDRKQAEEALREAEERFRTAFDEAPIGMALVGLDGRWLEVNDALCALTGYSEDQLLRKNFMEMTYRDDLRADEEHTRRLREGRITNYRTEKRFVHADGRPVWVSFNASLVRLKHRDPLYLITQVEDINERKHLEEELHHLAQHDSLTGLYNRRRFEKELQRQMKYVKRHGGGGAVLLLDLDKFKITNDIYGHAAGDEVLRTVAQVFRQTLRETDVSARLGGDEFALILPETDAPGAERVAEKLVFSVRNKMADGSREVKPSVSVGIAFYEADSELSKDDVLAAADGAMYEAKRAGGDRYFMRGAVGVLH
jgi:diguanylate cyclase (GGDEF)-like protein/PAS domain S-box-containing protein